MIENFVPCNTGLQVRHEDNPRAQCHIVGYATVDGVWVAVMIDPAGNLSPIKSTGSDLRIFQATTCVQIEDN